VIRQPSPRELNDLLRGVNQHGRQIVMTALRRGIRVARVSTKGGSVWRFRSPWCHIDTVDPKYLNERELNPV